MKHKKQQTVLAFDIGLKRTGVACGQTFTKTANPAGQLTVNNGRFDWSKLDSLLNEWQPQLIVIGDPQATDPHLNKVVNRFKSYIQQQHKIPIVQVNETLTSSAANTELSDNQLQGKLTTERKIKLRDQVAACLILESYFHSLN